jgi:hypothetical protein
MSTRDQVQLSERERQQLAGIQEMLQSRDPALARTLNGQERHYGPAVRFARRAAHLFMTAASRYPWVGPPLVLAGFIIVYAGLWSSLTWLGVPGELIACAGVAICGAGLQRRWAESHADHQVESPLVP